MDGLFCCCFCFLSFKSWASASEPLYQSGCSSHLYKPAQLSANNPIIYIITHSVNVGTFSWGKWMQWKSNDNCLINYLTFQKTSEPFFPVHLFLVPFIFSHVLTTIKKYNCKKHANHKKRITFRAIIEWLGWKTLQTSFPELITLVEQASTPRQWNTWFVEISCPGSFASCCLRVDMKLLRSLHWLIRNLELP